MEFLSYFLLGIVEGITEFLPISSTAHLILFSHLFKIPQTDFHKFFEITIQSGAISAVVFGYFKILITKKDLIRKILISFLPTAIISIVFYRAIKDIFFENEVLIISMLILVGIFFIVIENFIKKGKIKLDYSLNELTDWQSFLIGIFQALSIIPGVSRAGAVIMTMIFMKFRREDAVIYSFLLAVPTIIGAGIYELYQVSFRENLENFWTANNLVYLVIGFITSFVSALIAIRWFIKYLQKNDLTMFGYYRIILGVVFALLLYFYL
ncbi:MAG: undecaprenyl-diphosphate phosphatase [Patescibacteria group bacterium]|nr:undecaprenyl-diphosphate phosphatase [Patescibacteria group bacterium]